METKTIDLENLKKNAAVVKAFKWYVSDDSGDMYTLIFHAACQNGVDHRDLAVEIGTDPHDVVGGGYIYFDNVTKNIVVMGGSKEFGHIPTRAWIHDVNDLDIAQTLKELIPLWNEMTGDDFPPSGEYNFIEVYFTNYTLDEIIEASGDDFSCCSRSMLID